MSEVELPAPVKVTRVKTVYWRAEMMVDGRPFVADGESPEQARQNLKLAYNGCPEGRRRCPESKQRLGRS